MRSTTLRALLVGVGTALFSACSSNESTPAESTAPSETRLFVHLSTQVDTVPEATSKPIVARVTDASGILKSAPISWLSTNPAVATVSSGMISGVAPGTAYVIASAAGTADTVQVVVTQNDLTLDVQPSAAAVVRGDTINFVATLRSRAGEIVSVNHFQWSSSDTAAASILNAGSILTKREGDVTISAEALRRRGWSLIKIFRSGVASVSISPNTANVFVGSELELDVTLRDQWGREIEDGDVTFGSSNFLRATVDQDGVVTGKAPGSVVITATSGSRTASATINVLAKPATTLAIQIPSDTALIGTEVQAVAVSKDAEGNEIAGRAVAWQSQSSSIATVSSSGRIKGMAEGSTNISAISDGIVATRRVTVRNRQPASMTISPSAPSVTVGQSSQLFANVLDQAGNEISGQQVSWTSGNPQVISVSASGVIAAFTTGTAVITATSGSLTASVTATVTSLPVSSVVVSPVSLTLTVGEKGNVVALAKAADLTTLFGRSVSWTSLNPAVASVNDEGQVTANAAGSATVRATIEGKTANVAVTVLAPAPAGVATVLVSLGKSTLNVGETTQASAVLKDAQGNVLTGRSINWTSLDNGVASVSSNGLVTAKAGGTIAIMATSEGQSGAASLTVNTPPPAAVASVTISSPSQSLNIGQSVQTSVTLKDAAGNIISGRTITYSTENPTVLSVSATGLITAIGSGNTKVRVTSEGVTATSQTFTVAGATPPPSPVVTTISVSAPQTSLTVGNSTVATAVAKDQNGNTMSGQSFTWTTSKPTVATVSANGIVSAVGAGSATISASASGKVGTLQVTVTSAPAASYTIALTSTVDTVRPRPLSPHFALLRARVYNSSGTEVSDAGVTWHTSDTTAASYWNIQRTGYREFEIESPTKDQVVTITAKYQGVTKTHQVALVVTNGSGSNPDPNPPTTPPTPVDTTPLPPIGSSIAELPRVYLNFPFPAKTGQTIVVPSGGNLQNALNSAQRGDEIVLTAGATYTGNFTLPAKSGSASNGWITIRSDKFSQLPAIGTRVGPSNASVMAKIMTPDYAPAIRTAPGTSGWRLVGIEVTASPSISVQQYGLIYLGDVGAAQDNMNEVPSDIVLDRMYIHGQTTTNMSRCVMMNSARTQVSDSYLSECHGKGFDSQAIAGWNGPGPYRIVNNMLMGAGENLFFGGADPSINGLVPSDIEIRGNYLYTPASWKGVWMKKNLLELKNATRVLIEGNVLDGAWLDGQVGEAVVFKSVNQDGNCRWCRTTDVTFRRNLVRNAGGGIVIAGRPEGQPVDTPAQRISIQENVLENIGTGAFTGSRRGILLVAQAGAVLIERTVMAGSLAGALYSEAGAPCTIRDNVWTRGEYGVIASGAGVGSTALASGCGSYHWSGNSLVGSSNGAYPSGTSWVGSEGQAPLAAQIRSIVSAATAGVVIP